MSSVIENSIVKYNVVCDDVKREMIEEQPDSRKLATIRTVDGLEPIDGADFIETALIGGWSVIVKKGEFKVNDFAVYFEIDSWIPEIIAPFLFKNREYNNIPGARLKTVRMRGVLSQGLLLPVNILPDWFQIVEDADVTQLLQIQKYEVQDGIMQTNAKGNFPTQIPRTNQERVQNLSREMKRWHENSPTFEMTEKLDGSSMTVYFNDGNVGVCSRNLELKEDDQSAFWIAARNNDLPSKLISYDKNIAIQGELIGPKIQGNPYNLTVYKFFVFDIWDIDNQRYFTSDERIDFCGSFGLDHVPILFYVMELEKKLYEKNSNYLLDWAEGKSFINPKTTREGIVLKEVNGKFSMKCISNSWLLSKG